jgi:DNA-binding beta-propeller fold protein YncE
MQKKLFKLTLVMIMLMLLVTACGSKIQNPKANSASQVFATLKPSKIIPTPTGLFSMTVPDTSNYIYMLAGNTKTTGLYKLNLKTGKIPMSSSVSILDRQAILSSTGNVYLLQQSSVNSGSIILMNKTTLKPEKTIEVSYPVINIVPDTANPNLIYVLTGNKSAEMVMTIDLTSGKVVNKLPVSLDTMSIWINSKTVYTLLTNGNLQAFSLTSNKPTFDFGSFKTPIALTMSPNGQRAYVLKKENGNYSISVINMATEAQIGVIGAPLGAGVMTISPDGKTLYVGVCDPKFGNIQVYNLAAVESQQN